MSYYVYTRLLCSSTFSIALLFGIFSATRGGDKLESLNKHSLRFISNDSLFSYDELLNKAKYPYLLGRLHKILMVVFKSLFVSTYLVSWGSKTTIRFS